MRPAQRCEERLLPVSAPEPLFWLCYRDSMRSLLRKFINYLLGFAGLQISRKHVPDVLLRSANLATIIDGGANDGGFAFEARAFSPNAIIHSFEPVPWIYNKLALAFESDSKFHAHQLALSDVTGNLEFEINAGEYSSSLLPMRKDAIGVLPDIGPTDKRIRVEVTTLDAWAQDKELARPILLKLDIEGNELAALHGAINLLNHIDFVLTEVSLILMRDGQPTFREIVDLMSDKGFDVIDVYHGMMDHRTGQAAWVDVLFGRKTSIASKSIEQAGVARRTKSN